VTECSELLEASLGLQSPSLLAAGGEELSGARAWWAYGQTPPPEAQTLIDEIGVKGRQADL
jgi:hypothetical protein